VASPYNLELQASTPAPSHRRVKQGQEHVFRRATSSSSSVSYHHLSVASCVGLNTAIPSLISASRPILLPADINNNKRVANSVEAAIEET